MEIAKGSLGAEVNYDLKMLDGMLQVMAVYKGEQTGASVSVSVDPSKFLDKLKELIPGSVDDVVIELMKSALKAL